MQAYPRVMDYRVGGARMVKSLHAVLSCILVALWSVVLQDVDIRDMQVDVPPSSVPSMDRMPTAWMLQLTQLLDVKDAGALLATCRGVRDAILAHLPVKVELDLLAVSEDYSVLTQARQDLKVACKYSSHVSLLVYGNEQLEDGQVMLQGILQDVAAGPSRNTLKNVRTVELQGVDLDTVLPQWLMHLCDVQTLTLSQVPIGGLRNAGVPVHAYDRLTTLNLQLMREPSQESTDSQDEMRGWASLLHRLPGLSSLCLYFQAGLEHHDHWRRGDGDSLWLQCCAEAAAARRGPQLTELKVLSPGFPWQPDPATFAPSHFTRLVAMQLPGAMIDDQLLHTLQRNVPTLRRVGCFGLKLEKMGPHPLPWTHLAFEVLDVASFHCLMPQLIHIVCFHVNHVHRREDPPRLVLSEDLWQNKRVVTAILSKGGVQGWGELGQGLGMSADITLDNATKQADSLCVAMVMALLGGVAPGTGIRLFHVRPVTKAVLMAMVQNLPSEMHIIEFHGCTFSPDVWPMLLEYLPTSEVTLDSCEEIAESHFCEMCVRAKRPVNVQLVRGSAWAEGWDQRLLVAVRLAQTAMASAGHAHVQLFLQE